jgi:outer membrane protein assembly factor BamB
MKYKLLFITLLLLTMAITACSGSTTPSGWPGLSVDQQAGTVYLAFNTEVYALNISDGSLKWQFPQKADRNLSFFSAPALTSDGQLIIGGYDRKLHSLNPKNGSENWIFEKSQGRFIGSPLVTEAGIFAPNADENLYAMDFKGNSLWTFKTDQALWAKPAIQGNKLYMAGMDRHLYAINSQNGQQLWSQELSGASVATPTLSEDGMIYVGTFANELLAMDSNSGETKWRTPTQGWVWSDPVLNGDILYFGDLSGTLYAVDRNTGKINWKILPNGPIAGSPLIIGESIYFTTESGNLYAVDFQGKILWNKQIGGKIYTSPVEAGDQILIAPIGAGPLLISIDFDGNPKWSFTPVEKK